MNILANTNIGGADVGTTSTKVVEMNGARMLLVISNPSDTGVYINFGSAAEASKGGYLGARGGTMVFTEGDIHLGLAVYAITASGIGKRVTYMEGY